VTTVNKSLHVYSPILPLVTLARPPTLKITDRSFRYASSCLWNQLDPLSLRQPHSGTILVPVFPFSTYLIPSPITSSSSDSPFCALLPVTYLFHKSYPRSFTFFLPDCLHGLLSEPFHLSNSAFVFSRAVERLFF